jgi:diguanylate cyclase (GGDEF)-like protein/PAS domain S-box-containing protein
MPKERAPFRILFEDEDLKRALSEAGVFIVDRANRRQIVSAISKHEGFPETAFDGDESWLTALHPEDRERVRRSIQRVISGDDDTFHETFRVRTTDGRWDWIVSRGRVVGRECNGTPVFYIGTDTDISRLKRAEADLQQRNTELETLRHSATVIGASLDLTETVQRILAETQRIVPFRTATVQILHADHLEVLGGVGFDSTARIRGLTFPYPEVGSLSTRAIQEKRPWSSNDVAADFPAYYQVSGEVPTRSWLGIPLIRHGDVIGLIAADNPEYGVYTDHHLLLAGTIADHIAIALENARLHEETYRLAMTDALTGIGSRHRFQLEGRLLYEKALRQRHAISVAMIDVDRFKGVNDTYGHDAGDIVLKEVSQAIAGQIRSTDLLARFGGEEFVVLFPDEGQSEAEAAVERMRTTVAETSFSSIPISVTVSAGLVCEVPPSDQSFDRFITKADDAMYRSKEGGRNRVTTWDSAMESRSRMP